MKTTTTTGILAGALAFGAAILPTVSVTNDRGSVALAKEKEFDEEIRYADLPDHVKRAVDKLRRDHQVKAFYHVRRDGKEFYRAVIDTKGDDKVVRIKPGGELMTEQDVRDVSDREISDRARTAKYGERRAVRLARDETDGSVVDFDRLPGPVKTEIGRLAKGEPVKEVVRYQHRGKTMYRAEVGEGKYTRFIRVGEGGNVEGVRGDIDPGEVVRFDRLPGTVKAKLGALARGGKVDEVIEYKRGDRTFYQAQVDDKNGRAYFYTVDDRGREVEALPPV